MGIAGKEPLLVKRTGCERQATEGSRRRSIRRCDEGDNKHEAFRHFHHFRTCLSRFPLKRRSYGKRSISADTALRLGRFFKMNAEFWINLQSHYDLEMQSDKLGKKLEAEVIVLKAS